MAGIHKCDYIDPRTGIECGEELYPIPKRDGFIECKKDNNKKHIIKVNPTWGSLVNKPDDIDNIIFTMLMMKLLATETPLLTEKSTRADVKDVINELIISPCQTDYASDENLKNSIIAKFNDLFG